MFKEPIAPEFLRVYISAVKLFVQGYIFDPSKNASLYVQRNKNMHSFRQLCLCSTQRFCKCPDGLLAPSLQRTSDQYKAQLCVMSGKKLECNSLRINTNICGWNIFGVPKYRANNFRAESFWICSSESPIYKFYLMLLRKVILSGNMFNFATLK